MNQPLFILGLVLFFGLLTPLLLRRFHLPFSSSLILAGAVVGPFGLDYVQSNEALDLFGSLGAAFFMLFAGFEAKTLKPEISAHQGAVLIVSNGVFPMVAGVAIGSLFGFSWTTSWYLGAVFMSTSIMLVFSFVRNSSLDSSSTGRILKWLTVVLELLAALLIFAVFKSVEPHHRFPLPILLGLLISAIVAMRMFVPETVSYLLAKMDPQDEHEESTRLVLALLLVSIFAFSFLQVHPVIAAFVVGYSFAGIPQTEHVTRKLRTIGYAVFIPVFLFVVGIETDFRLLWELEVTNTLLITCLTAAVSTKIIGGAVGGVMIGLNIRQSMLLGTGSSVKMTMALTTSYSAYQLGIIDATLYTVLVTLSLISTVITPLAFDRLARSSHQEV